VSDDVPEQDIRKSLARAFDRAWGNYIRPGQLNVGHDRARTELARRIVQLSQSGVTDEATFAEAGLRHPRNLD
jgi:hypothetical protein